MPDPSLPLTAHSEQIKIGGASVAIQEDGTLVIDKAK